MSHASTIGIDLSATTLVDNRNPTTLAGEKSVIVTSSGLVTKPTFQWGKEQLGPFASEAQKTSELCLG